MATIAAEDLTALTDSLRRLLQDKSAEADVRRTMETPSGYDPELWRQLAEMGVAGLVIDEAYGGVGAGPVELERVMEEAGAALLCAPLVSSGVLAAGLIQALGDEATKTRLLPTIADGSRIATVALTGAKGGWTANDVAVTAAGAGEAWTLNGVASFVTHGQIADVILVVAKAPDGLAVFEVEPAAAGLTIKPLPTFDHTLRLAELSFAAHAGPAARRPRGRSGRRSRRRSTWPASPWPANRPAAPGGRWSSPSTTPRPASSSAALIGSFQAIKHMAADLLLESESAISAARAAARSLADGDEGRAGRDQPRRLRLRRRLLDDHGDRDPDARRHRLHLGPPGPPLPAPRPRRRPAVRLAGGLSRALPRSPRRLGLGA